MLKNKKLSDYHLKKIILYFCADITASQSAILLGRNRNTINHWYGVFERDGRVYTEIIPGCKKAMLQAVILGKVSADSVIYSDGSRGYNGLVDVGYSKHFRVYHGANEFARDGHCHINGIEPFWSFTKRCLAKFNGVKVNFELHLKECEWRWKKDADMLAKELWKILRESSAC